jgi:hypothetical protein
MDGDFRRFGFDRGDHQYGHVNAMKPHFCLSAGYAKLAK